MRTSLLPTASPRGRHSPHQQYVARFTLTGTEPAEVSRLAARVVAEHHDLESARCLEDIAVIAHDLPIRLRRFISGIRHDESMHAIVISGHDIDDRGLGGTPLSWNTEPSDGARHAGAVLLLHAALLGDVFSWTTQQEGRLLADVHPIRGMEESLVSASSESELNWHTEDAFSPYRADYVGLFCLRSPLGTPTTLSYADTSELPDDVVRVLTEPRFVCLPDDSHRIAGGNVRPAPRPVLSGPPEAMTLRIDRDFTRAVQGDTEAEAALCRLIEHIDANVYEVGLSAGEIGFIDNRTAVHGRRSFTPTYDGCDRWLKRVNIAVDLRRTRPGRAHARTRAVGRAAEVVR